MITLITSTQNKHVKEWKKLHRRKYREKTGSFLIEGEHLIEEAYKTDQHFEALILEETKENPGWLEDSFVYRVSKEVFQEIAQTETPQGILAVLRRKKMQAKTNHSVLLIDCVQDPGNLGTLIRTADAAGFSKVVLGKGTVDLYNDKVIRATQGSLFHLPIEQKDLEKEIPALQKEGFSIWATTLQRAKNYIDIIPSEKTAIILGNEGRGVNPAFIEKADELVKIPIFGKAESLNVGVAGGILMYYIRN